MLSPRSRTNKIGLFSKFKLNSFAFYPTSRTSKANLRNFAGTNTNKGISISSPTNFTHVTGTAKLNLIPLDVAKTREKAFYSGSSSSADEESKFSATSDDVKEGWIRLLDSKTNRFYYHNEQRNITQWERP